MSTVSAVVPTFVYRLRRWIERAIPHLILIAYTALALFPILLILMNSLKDRSGIFGAPYRLPIGQLFSTVGYQTVLARASFPLYFLNSIIVTGVSLLLVLLIGAMAAYALSEYKFRGNAMIALYLSLGIMIPIRLGTVGILKLMKALGLTDTLASLILVYLAQGLPLTILILSQFMRQVPRDLKDAFRIDGASEYRIFWFILPLVRPAVGAIGIFTMIPIWNDLWFPLVLAPSNNVQTVTLGIQVFLGQYISDWPAVLASLSLAMAPVMIFYLVFSRQMMRSITAGALK